MGAGDVEHTTAGDTYGVEISVLRVPGRCRGRCALLLIIVQGRLRFIVAGIFEFDELVRELSDCKVIWIAGTRQVEE
jgi:hypothetical protein